MEADEGLEPDPAAAPAQPDPGDAPADVPEAAAAAAADPSSRDPRPRALLILLAVVLLIAVIGVIVYEVKGPGADPNAAIESAVAHSVQGRTADVALSLTIGAAGTTESIAGNGTTNLRTNATNMTMTVNAGGRSLVERTIVDGNTGYFNLGPLVGQVAPGKSWVSLDVSSASQGPNGVAGGGIFSDPNIMVSVLRSTGTSVTPLGSSVVDGVAVQGYTIHLSPTGITASTSHVPPSLRSALKAAHFTRLEYTVYIDGANYLKEIRGVGTFGAVGITANVTSAMHFADYGIPVSVAPPPADQVITEKQFQRLEVQSQGLANT